MKTPFSTTVQTTWNDLLLALREAAAELVDDEQEREALIVKAIRDLEPYAVPTGRRAA